MPDGGSFFKNSQLIIMIKYRMIKGVACVLPVAAPTARRDFLANLEKINNQWRTGASGRDHAGMDPGLNGYQGTTPAVGLVDPKFPHNVGAAVRAASCYGIGQVWFSGDRVRLDASRGYRLPREERMRGCHEAKTNSAWVPQGQ
jgi:hypothetical protein